MKLIYTILLLVISSAVQTTAYAETAQSKKTLIFGLLPSESAVAKFKRYAPLRDYLTHTLGYEIRLETARDFAEFIRRTNDRRYDLLETAPHLVSAALDNNNYSVVTTLTQPLTAQIVVLKNSPFTNINQLGNKKIATPSAKAIITKIGKETLNSALGNNLPTYQIYKTHNAAYEAVLSHHADAAIISVNLYNNAINKNVALTSIGESIQIPNMSILIANNLGSPVQKEFQTLLINMKNTEEGRKVLKKMSYPGYRKTDASEFNNLRKYTK